MDARHELRALAVALVVIQQHFPGFFIQGRFGIRTDEQALDHGQDVGDAVSRFPVFLQRIDADIST